MYLLFIKLEPLSPVNKLLHSVIKDSIVSASIESKPSLIFKVSARVIICFKISWSLTISLPLGNVVSLNGKGLILTLPTWPSYLPNDWLL